MASLGSLRAPEGGYVPMSFPEPARWLPAPRRLRQRHHRPLRLDDRQRHDRQVPARRLRPGHQPPLAPAREHRPHQPHQPYDPRERAGGNPSLPALEASHGAKS